MESTESTSSASTGAITVVSSNGEEYELTPELASQSETLAKLVSNFDCDHKDVKKEPIPLKNISSVQLEKIIVWLEHHKNSPRWIPSTDKRKVPSYSFDEWTNNYLNLSNDELFQLVNAANYLHIPHLFHVACKKVSSMISGKTSDQIRDAFNVKEDTDSPIHESNHPHKEDSFSNSEDSESREGSGSSSGSPI